MDFPRYISFTLTNTCNLRCRMCGQWSGEGYMHERKDDLKREMTLADWKRLVDEAAEHGVRSVLLRGGETFLFPGIIGLLEHISAKGMFASIDTNGTMLKRYAADIVRIGDIHMTVSVDGPEEIHDAVRGVKGCFGRIKEGLAALEDAERTRGKKISRSICFTISPYSYGGLGVMPEVARGMGVPAVSIVPYYYVPETVGRQYEKELRELGCPAFSWTGFHHESSGVDFDGFLTQYRTYLATLHEVKNYPYMALTEDGYRTWFSDALTPVGSTICNNVEKLIDVQPGGEANFCVDFPDYSMGNVRESTISEVWNGGKAARFREYRRRQPLAVCHRCGAKYMSENGL